MTTSDYVAAIDLGGTHVRVAIVDRQGRLLASQRDDTRAADGPEQAIKRVVNNINNLLNKQNGLSIAAIGASLGSPVDSRSGTLVKPPNLPGWDGYSMKPDLEKAFNVPAFLGNDANLAVAGEQRYGAGRGLTDLIFITISTGIGGGIMSQGRVLTGSRGFAGEVGHMTVHAHGPQCPCGNIGCLEMMASGTAIARRAKQKLDEGAEGLLKGQVDRTGKPVTAKDVADAARQNDALAGEILDEAMYYLGIGIASLAHIFDPQAVLLGGGVMQNYDLLRPSLARITEEHLMTHMRGRDLIRQCALGDEVSLYGAAAHAFDMLS